jgi:uncharacterized protein with HEPN domain
VALNPDKDRLQFLLETTRKEARHLRQTVDRLTEEPITAQWVSQLEHEPELSERLDAFVARFGRLQDTLGDKLIPELLGHLLEDVGATLDNLARMERLGYLPSVADWVEARNLRNRLIHEYMRDPEEFAQALRRAMDLTPLLEQTREKLAEAAKRFTNG